MAEEMCNDCWIGATCSDRNDRKFHWVDDSDWEYTAWSSGEPNDGINPEDCVHIFDESTWKMCGNWWFSRLFIGIWSASVTYFRVYLNLQCFSGKIQHLSGNQHFSIICQ